MLSHFIIIFPFFLSNAFFSVLSQYEETQTELSDLKEKYEQEKESLRLELQQCQASLKCLQEKGNQVSFTLVLYFSAGFWQ